MDLLTTEEWNAQRDLDPERWDQKYARRYQRGHVVEIRENGFWSDKGQYPRADVFRVLLVPRVTAAQARYLLEDGTYELRRFRITTGEDSQVSTLQQITQLQVVEEP